MNGHEARRSRLVDSNVFAAGSVFVTNDPPSVRYLTGFSGSNGALVIDGDRYLLVTDGRYGQQAAQECPGIEIVIERDFVVALSNVVGDRSVLLDDQMPMSLGTRLSASGIATTPVANPITELRAIKDDHEVEQLRHACRITAEALTGLAAELRVGDREVDIARRLEELFGRMGADDRAFASIVASGENSAIPHHRAGQRALCEGDLLIIDCGAMVAGYHADMTRTFIVAADPEPWQMEIHSVVHRAQEAALQRLQPGVIAGEVDGSARTVIAEAGFAAGLLHGTGHGVGLRIHEAPMIIANSEDQIFVGAVVTVEPGIYLPGRGGVRIEDSVLVSHTPQVLTSMNRALTRVA